MFYHTLGSSPLANWVIQVVKESILDPVWGQVNNTEILYSEALFDWYAGGQKLSDQTCKGADASFTFQIIT
jgi:hypothetical protein